MESSLEQLLTTEYEISLHVPPGAASFRIMSEWLLHLALPAHIPGRRSQCGLLARSPDMFSSVRNGRACFRDVFWTLSMECAVRRWRIVTNLPELLSNVSPPAASACHLSARSGISQSAKRSDSRYLTLRASKGPKARRNPQIPPGTRTPAWSCIARKHACGAILHRSGNHRKLLHKVLLGLIHLSGVTTEQVHMQFVLSRRKWPEGSDLIVNNQPLARHDGAFV